MKTIWLSFADPDAPTSTTSFLGVAIVEITEEDEAEALKRFPDMADPEKGKVVVAAAIKASEKGCNPGGEIQAMELDAEQAKSIDPAHKHKLLNKAELREAGFISTEVVKVSPRTVH